MSIAFSRLREYNETVAFPILPLRPVGRRFLAKIDVRVAFGLFARNLFSGFGFFHYALGLR